MAIYHLSSGFVSRSTGRSSVQNAAYITGEALHESRRNLDVNYKNRSSDISFTKTLIPDGVDASFAHLSIWDKLESFEDVYAQKRFPNGDHAREKYMNTCQTGMTIVVALPSELSLDSSKELIEDFLNDRFISRGLISTYAIHNEEGNPHAHFLISRRSINEKGEFSWYKDREICTKKELLKTRSLWAEKTNFYLERDGHEVRITEKSFLDLGVDLHPTKHHGWYADKLIDEGKASRIIDENEKVFLGNKQKIENDPTIVLNEITTKQATFSQKDLLRHIQKRIGDDIETVSFIFEKCLANSTFVGTHIDGLPRYTSSIYQQSEEKALSLLSDFKDMTFNQNITTETIEKIVLENHNSLIDEQRNAVFGLLKNNSLSVLIGRAGAGKTTTLRAISDIYKKAGFSVFGVSLSALASDNLGIEANINTSTLHSLLFKLDAYKEAQEKFLAFDSIMEEGLFKQLDWYQNLIRYERHQLTEKHVIIVDEAGMVGTKQWMSLLEHAKKAKAKIIAVGDDNQFKAIDAGDFFREIKNQFKDHLFNLSYIHRQKEDWLKKATLAFANLDVQEGLTTYMNRGFVHETDQRNIATDIAKDYIKFIAIEKDVAVLAYTHKQNKEINQEIRSLLKEKNKLGNDCLFEIQNQPFSKNEKIVFLKNDKKNVTITNEFGEKMDKHFIKNGTTGHIISADHQGNVCVHLKDQIFAHFNVKEYNHIDYGYALTVHKSQGKTVDITLIAASKQMDAKAIYVGLTRHRKEAHLYYTKEDFKTINHLKIAFSKFEDKDLVKDYTIHTKNEAAFNRVQDYKMCVLDGAALFKNKDDFDAKIYRDIKQEQIKLGKEILNDFESHRLFINQSGLTQEMLKISVGKMQRPLSLIEEQAKLRVELYGETALAARELWKELKGKDLRQHKEQYTKFKELQNDRNALAKDILDDYKRHATFIKTFQKTYGISQKTMQKQVESFEKNHVKNGSQKESQSLETKSLFIEKSTNQTPNTPKQFDKSPHEIVNELNLNIKDLAHHFLGKPTHQTSREWRYGKKGSLSIKVAGMRQGLYANFETGESGNVIKFIADQMNIDKKEAFKWGVHYLGHDRMPTQQKIQKDHVPTSFAKDYIPIFPIPSSVPYPKLRSEKQLAYMLKGRHEVAKFEYKDADGKTLGYVVRLEDKEGNKITPTLTYCKKMLDLNSSASSDLTPSTPEHSWRFQGFADDRPLYGLDVLKQKASAPVLIVEGEKTCEAAREIFKDHAVITWNGGCGSVHKSDWSVLKNRDVTIFPDHDKAGKTAAHKIADILKEDTAKSITIVDLPSTLPHKWDLADPLPHDMHYHDLMNKKIHVFEKKQDIKNKEEPYKRYQLERSEIESIAKENNLYLDHKNHLKETRFINDVYNSYLRMYPKSKDDDVKKYSVEMGGFMHTYHEMYNLEKNKDNYIKSYKAAYCVYEMKCEKLSAALHKAHHLEEKGQLDNIMEQKFSSSQQFDKHMNSIENYYRQNKNVIETRKKIYQKISNQEEWFQKEEIESIAKSIGLILNQGKEHIDIVLINTLYSAYRKEFSNLTNNDHIKKAVQNGIMMSKNLKNNAPGKLKADDLINAYMHSLQHNNYENKHSQHNDMNHQYHINRMQHIFEKNTHKIDEHLTVQKRFFDVHEHQQQQNIMHQQQIHQQHQREQMHVQRSLSLDFER